MQPNVWPYLYANISCVKWCPETTDYIWRESEGVDCRRTMHPTFETMILHIKVVLHIWFHWDVLFFTMNMALTPRGHHRSPFSWPWATPLVTKKSNGICPPFQFSKRWQHFSLSPWLVLSAEPSINQRQRSPLLALGGRGWPQERQGYLHCPLALTCPYELIRKWGDPHTMGELLPSRLSVLYSLRTQDGLQEIERN